MYQNVVCDEKLRREINSYNVQVFMIYNFETLDSLCYLAGFIDCVFRKIHGFVKKNQTDNLFINNKFGGAVVAVRSRALILLHGTGGPRFESRPSFKFFLHNFLSHCYLNEGWKVLLQKCLVSDY